MKKIAILCFCIFTLKGFAQLPPEKSLYPGGLSKNPVSHPMPESYVDSTVNPKSVTGLNRVYSNVSEPTYMVFPANPVYDKHIGLVIYPGGGLKNIWLDKEGTDIAKWLSERGITCMVVKYRTNRKEGGEWAIDFDAYKGAIYKDARISMITMRALADSLDFDKEKVGMMGFSAGGWLAERMVYKYYTEEHEWNPDFVALIYHGSTVQRIKKAEHKEMLPPFFMAIASNDEKMPVKKVIPYLERVEEEVEGSELHVYPDGGHGFGLAYDESTQVSGWKDAFLQWVIALEK